MRRLTSSITILIRCTPCVVSVYEYACFQGPPGDFGPKGIRGPKGPQGAMVNRPVSLITIMKCAETQF